MIDAVIISHNHYDHLSLPDVLKIKEKHPNCQFFAPLGNKKWFDASEVKNATELDWWESRDLKLSRIDSDSKEKRVSVESATTGGGSAADITATISCLPCQHMTGRSLTDRMATLWSSWSVESGGKKVYFGGYVVNNCYETVWYTKLEHSDTGYRAVPEESEGEDDYGEKYAHLPHCPVFKQIGDLRGPFDLGMIPIGACKLPKRSRNILSNLTNAADEPRYIMSPMHANPYDSVHIFSDTKCKRAMGIHWGTWVLTEEDVLEPPRLLKDALKKNNIPEEGVFDVCEIGESREF
jgi:N-acyl-phosphatidylethanolamine-hydrolysing phospholipase D